MKNHEKAKADTLQSRTYRLPRKTVERLADFSHRSGRKLDWIVREAVEQYITREDSI